MKLITIGRDTDNSIVINDSKVSRHHLQIICEGDNFRIVDLGSTNGTFVNDCKITGETRLYPNDTVRIGNTVLPWQSYFKDKRLKMKDKRLWIATVMVSVALVLTYFLIFNDKDENSVIQTIKMVEKNGVRYIPVKINGQELDFVLDTGASSICISTLEAALLYKKGVFSEKDIIDYEQFVTASGEISVGAKIILKTVKIGDKELNGIEATIVENPRAECLLGQTVLSKFGKYTIDNQNNEIIFE
ncbi:MAG: FHA domain-containing protein [Prevotella sp.]|jgi:aspartyl protease family protein|nr:FHA domain-containing protein [Prevotella sp.]